METWKDHLEVEMWVSLDPGPVISYAPNKEAFKGRPDEGVDAPEILAWTQSRVYFPVIRDDVEQMGSAPRNPVDSGGEGK